MELWPQIPKGTSLKELAEDESHGFTIVDRLGGYVAEHIDDPEYDEDAQASLPKEAAKHAQTETERALRTTLRYSLNTLSVDEVKRIVDEETRR